MSKWEEKWSFLKSIHLLLLLKRLPTPTTYKLVIPPSQQSIICLGLSDIALKQSFGLVLIHPATYETYSCLKHKIWISHNWIAHLYQHLLYVSCIHDVRFQNIHLHEENARLLRDSRHTTKMYIILYLVHIFFWFYLLTKIVCLDQIIVLPFSLEPNIHRTFLFNII